MKNKPTNSNIDLGSNSPPDPEPESNLGEYINEQKYDIDVIIENSAWYNIEFNLTQHIIEIGTLTIDIIKNNKIHNKIINYIKNKNIEFTILLSNDAKLKSLNKTYRDKDYPTNVLSFEYIDSHHIDNDVHYYRSTMNDDTMNDNTIEIDPEYEKQILNRIYLGDIAISYERIMEESIELGKTFKEYLTHIVIHGILHLLKYTHDDEKNAEIMENLEIEIMEILKYDNPYK